MRNRIRGNAQGFTLLELLVVIGIIGILAAIVIVAINPARQFAQARNAQRWNDVNAILNAVHQYAVDNNGGTPGDLTDSTYFMLGTDGGDCSAECTAQAVDAACLDLTTELVGSAGELYLSAMPTDPDAGTTALSDYYIYEDGTTGRVTVGACESELSVGINVTR